MKFNNKNVRIWDNGGKTIDRYLVLIDDEHLISMSHNPLSPQGYNAYLDNVTNMIFSDVNYPEIGSKKWIKTNGNEITNSRDIPEEVLTAINKRIDEFNEGIFI